MIELKFEAFIPDSISPPSENFVYSEGNQVVSEGNIVVSGE